MTSIKDSSHEFHPSGVGGCASPAKNRLYPSGDNNNPDRARDRDCERALFLEQHVSQSDAPGDNPGALLDIYRETRLQESGAPVGVVEKGTPEAQYTEAEKRAWRIRQLKLTGSRTRAALDIACRYVDEVEKGTKEHETRLSLFGSFLKCHKTKRQIVDLLAIDGNLTVSGVWRCRSKWICPECAQRGLWAETQRLKGLLWAIQRENVERNIVDAPPLVCLLVTLTAPHKPGEPLRQQMSAFSTAYGKTLHSTAMRKARERLGYIGSVRCYDHTVTVGAPGLNDWHTHLHNLLIFETKELQPGSVGLDEFAALMFDEWRKAVAKAYGDNRQAVKQAFSVEYVNLESTAEHSAAAVADYAAKLAVLPGYMTKGTKGAPLDPARRRSLAPYDLLDIYNSTNAADVAAAWVEYCEGTKGFHRVDFGTGLLDRFGLRKERETATARYMLPPDVAAVALASPLFMSDLKAAILDGDISRVEALLLSYDLAPNYAQDICRPGEYVAPITQKQLEQARDKARRARKEKNDGKQPISA